jgi:hypothetical protein
MCSFEFDNPCEFGRFESFEDCFACEFVEFLPFGNGFTLNRFENCRSSAVWLSRWCWIDVAAENDIKTIVNIEAEVDLA